MVLSLLLLYAVLQTFGLEDFRNTLERYVLHWGIGQQYALLRTALVSRVSQFFVSLTSLGTQPNFSLRPDPTGAKKAGCGLGGLEEFLAAELVGEGLVYLPVAENVAQSF